VWGGPQTACRLSSRHIAHFTHFTLQLAGFLQNEFAHLRAEEEPARKERIQVSPYVTDESSFFRHEQDARCSNHRQPEFPRNAAGQLVVQNDRSCIYLNGQTDRFALPRAEGRPLRLHFQRLSQWPETNPGPWSDSQAGFRRNCIGIGTFSNR